MSPRMRPDDGAVFVARRALTGELAVLARLVELHFLDAEHAQAGRGGPGFSGQPEDFWFGLRCIVDEMRKHLAVLAAAEDAR